MIELIIKIKQHNIDIEIVDGKIKLDIPENFNSPELIDEIRENKIKLIEFLQNRNFYKKYDSINKVNAKDFYVLSSVQKRLFFLYEFDKSSLAYNMPQVVKLEGNIDKGKLTNVFNKLIARHESLRTFFDVINDEAVQKILDQAKFEIEYYNSNEGEVPQIIKNFIRPFNLSKAPLIRAGLIENSPSEHILMVDMHHIITDGVSMGIMIKDFLSIYNNQELPELRLQYKDYAEWQQSKGLKEKIAKQGEFWLNELAEEVTTLDLPIDYKRPSTISFEGNTVGFTISTEEKNQLISISEIEGATLFMVLLSIYNILLSKLSNQEDIVVGTPVAGRGHTDLENMIGVFVNTLPLRNYPKGDLSFREFLSQVKNRTLACFNNQTYQYEELVDKLKVQRDMGRNPLIDVMFVFQNIEAEEFKIPELTLKPYKSGHAISKFDLTLTVAESKEQIFLSFEYSTELFSKETIENVLIYFRKIVSVVITDPSKKISKIEILSEKEKQQLLSEFNNTKAEYPKNKTVIELFEGQVKKYPENKAVIFEDVSLSYKILNEKANQLAHYLLQHTALQNDDLIGVMMNSGEWMIISILGILKTGAAYVPISPSYPQARIDLMIKDCDTKVVLTTVEFRHQVTGVNAVIVAPTIIEGQPTENFVIKCKANNLAYVMYTSGSTGKPKGVLIEHKSVLSRLVNPDFIQIKADDRLLMTGAIVFDITTFEIWSCLLNGASLVLLKEELLLEPRPFAQYIKQNNISILHLVPQLFNQIAEYDITVFKNLRYFLIGGDLVRPKNVNVLRKEYPELKILHMYGPTENTTFSTYFSVDKVYDNSIPIGRPVSNSTVYILDISGNLQPIGVKGELCVGGESLSRGYLHQRSLTVESNLLTILFTTKGEKLYRL